MKSNSPRWLAQIFSSVLVFCMGTSHSLVWAQNDPHLDKKLACYEILKKGALEAFGYKPPATYDDFLLKARKVDSKHTVFATHLTEPLFRFEQYRHGRRLFEGNAHERFGNILEIMPDEPSFRFQEFEVNFLSSFDPEEDQSYFEYCGVRIMESLDEERPLFGMTQEAFGMIDPVIYDEFKDIRQGRQRFKTVTKSRIMRDVQMNPIGRWKAFAVFPKDESNDFFDLYEMSFYLKQLFDHRRDLIELRTKNALFKIIQAADPQKGLPEIKEDQRTGLQMINGVLSSIDQFKAINMKFHQRLILEGKNISKYVSMPVYDDDEQRETWRNFQNGLTSEPMIEVPPQKLPALLYIQDMLDGTQDEMAKIIAKEGEPCFSEEEKSDFKEKMSALDEKYKVGNMKLERTPGIYSWPKINIKRGNDLSPEEWQAYTSERWAIEKEYRGGIKRCMQRGAEGCSLTEAEKIEMDLLTVTYEKNMDQVRSSDQNASDRNQRIAALSQEYRQALESITSKCSLFLEAKGQALQAPKNEPTDPDADLRKAQEASEQARMEFLMTTLKIFPVVFLLIFIMWYWKKKISE